MTVPVHSLLSPSARGRWGNCPGSVRLINAMNLEAGESSPAAKDGTHSHTVLEYCIKNNKSPLDCIGEVFTDHEGQFTVNKDRADRVSIVLAYIALRVLEMGGVEDIHAETRVSPSSLVGRDDMDGTIDVQLSTPEFFELIDLKDGMFPVEAVDNEQLEQYAVGVIAERMAAGIFSTKSMRLTIVQPKLMIKGLDPVSSWELTVEELFNRLPTLIQQAAATDDPNAPLVPGEKQCRYCPAAGTCTAYAQFSLGEAGIKFGPTGDVKELFELAIKRDDELMTDDKLREIILAAPMLRKMIENAETEALRRITSGKPVEGLKAIMSPGRRAWAQDEEATAEKLKKMGVPKDAIWEQKLVSPVTVIDKLVWRNRAGEENRLSAKQIALLEKEYVKKSEGKLSVVPVDDKRQAVEFGDLEKLFKPAQPEQSVPEQTPSWLS